MSSLPRVLLIILECNPEWASIPRFGYGLFEALARQADVTLVTHIRNRPALERVSDTRRIVFIPENPHIARYYHLLYNLVMYKRANWFLLHFLGYPMYADFNRRVFQTMQARVRRGEFEIVHAYTPVMPRYPYAIVEACVQTPFILGPVNGGLPYPHAFRALGRAEFSYLHPLRGAPHLLPGYRRTYQRAAKILAGSAYTCALIQRMFQPAPARLELLHDTGIGDTAFVQHVQATAEPLRLLFVGRLVPLKGVDMLLDALQALDRQTPGNFTLTIVGDGEQREALENQARTLGIAQHIHFVGWVPPDDIAPYYARADIFCFPSIREFGGAVVLEAMAAGLPCLVADYGGISEFVTPETGFKLSVASRAQLIDDLAASIQRLAQDTALVNTMRRAAVLRAREFTWDVKAARLLKIYENTPESKSNGARAV